MKGIVIIISNNEVILGYSKSLEKHGYTVVRCKSDEHLIDVCKKKTVNLIVVDSNYCGLYLLEVLRRIQDAIFAIPILVMLNEQNASLISECLSLGISEYLVLSCSRRYFIQKIIRIINTGSHRKNKITIFSNSIQRQIARLIGVSKEILEIREKIYTWITQEYPVLLLLGESGTGKNFIADIINEIELSRKEKFVIVNCATISENLAETELFGSVEGAFTDSKNHKGLFEEANGGILFLDEINELSLVVQAKLLHAVETGSFLRVGGVTPIKVNLRLICATNANILEYVYEKRFRFDLYNRISMYQVFLPPLRDRKEDIMLFCDFFLRNTKFKISQYVQDFFLHYSWPGNIRELHKVVMNAMCTCKTDVIKLCDIKVETVFESPPEDY